MATNQQTTYEDVLENMGLVEKDEKPFWTKYLKNDFGEEQDEGDNYLQNVLDVFDGKKTVDEVVKDKGQPNIDHG